MSTIEELTVQLGKSQRSLNGHQEAWPPFQGHPQHFRPFRPQSHSSSSGRPSFTTPAWVMWCGKESQELRISHQGPGSASACHQLAV